MKPIGKIIPTLYGTPSDTESFFHKLLGRARVSRLLPLLWLLVLPAVVNAQFTFTTNNDGSLNVASFNGSGAVNIPSMTNGLPVTTIGTNAFYEGTLSSVIMPNSIISIGEQAFQLCRNLTNVMIGSGLDSIGYQAFASCQGMKAFSVDPGNPNYSSVDGVLFNGDQTTLVLYPEGLNSGYTISNGVTTIGTNAFFMCHLSSITIPDSVTNIESVAFWGCVILRSVTIPGSVITIGDSAFAFDGLTNITIGNSVTSIGIGAFGYTRITSVTIPNSVTNIGDSAFADCYRLVAAYFYGNAPAGDSFVFSGDTNATAYYLPGMSGWGTSFGGIPTALWLPQIGTGTGLGIQNNQFSFNINWASNMVVVVEACSDLANPIWQSIQTNVLVNTSFYFSDPEWTNYSSRFYRLRSP